MGIKNIHIILIGLAIILCMVFGMWGLGNGKSALAGLAFLTAFMLTIYGVMFIKKTKALDL